MTFQTNRKNPGADPNSRNAIGGHGRSMRTASKYATSPASSGSAPRPSGSDLNPGNSKAAPRRAVEVRRLVARGVDKLKIAKRLGVNPCVVYDVPAARPVPLPQRFGPQVKGLRAQGLSLSAIESALKPSRTTVKRALATNESVVHHRRPGKRSPQRQRALKVMKLLADGVPKSHIVKHLKMGFSTIYRVIRAENAGTPVAIRPKRKPDAKRVRRLFAQGNSQNEIARRLGMSQTTVRLLLGYERPPVPPDRAQQVRDLFAAGDSKSAISKKIKMSLSDVYRVLPASVRPPESVSVQPDTVAPPAARDNHRAVR